jgi:hypothetical protein
MSKSEHITQEMLDLIPKEWQEKIQKTPDVYRGPSDEEKKAIDAMLILYHRTKSKAALARIMKMTVNEINKRIKILQEQGKL